MTQQNQLVLEGEDVLHFIHKIKNNIMRFFIILSVLFMSLDSFAQNNNLNKMTKKIRNEYLIGMGKKVMAEFGPDWYNDSLQVSISKEKTFNQKEFGTGGNKEKYYGGTYYTVTFFNEQKENEPVWKYAAQVSIWADNGEPMMIIYGNGVGNQFYSGPTYQMIKQSGIPKESIIPYKPYKDVVAHIRQSILGKQTK